jgi:carbamoyltransferase
VHGQLDHVGRLPSRFEWRQALARFYGTVGPAPDAGAAGAPPHALLGMAPQRHSVAQHVIQCGGQPIVNRALEGYSTFRRCGIDALVAGPILVTKRAAPPRPSGRDELA